MKKIKLTPAFTMLELIFVIIILGIVASIGSEVIVKVYEGYIMQRAQHRATLKTELAALQISNRLISAIPGTLYRIKDGGNVESVEASMAGIGSTYKGLQWVASDTDTFNTSQKPGWSGFCDLNQSTKNSVVSPGSNLPITVSALQHLTGLPLLGLSNRTALYFPEDEIPYIVHHVNMPNNTFFLDNNASLMREHYKLAWTSYALVVEANTDGGQDLNLYYNFMPTPATANSYVAGTKTLLLHNVSTFRFKITGRTMRFKICKQEAISEDVNITACKEKAVF